MAAIKKHSFSHAPLVVASRRMVTFGKAAVFACAAAVFCSSAMAQKNTNTPANPQYGTPASLGIYDLLGDDQLSGPEIDPLLADIQAGEGNELWHDYAISNTDSIDKVFLNEGLSQLDLMKLLNTAEGIEFLTDLSQAHSLRYQLDNMGRLKALDIVLTTNERLRFERDMANGNAEFSMSIMEESVSQEMKRIVGDIEGSFYKSAKAVGLSVSTIQQFANIFQWQIDFNRDLRAGDRFEILLKENSDDDKQIVAARLYQKNKTFSAIRYIDGKYFTEEGKLLGSSFSRFPLGEGYRVSSHFNLARKHPITGKVQAHKGTDWAVPVGTPVKAPADGVVVKAVRKHRMAGNYIEIRNGRKYVTRYLHLDSMKVKVGDKVSKGQVIGKTGNTGLSTGPHLHYELYVNGRPVDVMKARLPEGKALKGTELAQFKKATAEKVAMLDQRDSSMLLAKRLEKTGSSDL